MKRGAGSAVGATEDTLIEGSAVGVARGGVEGAVADCWALLVPIPEDAAGKGDSGDSGGGACRPV